jgi:hypothetical protein
MMTESSDVSISISPQALKAVLTEANWQFARQVRQNAEIWRRGDDEVLVPLSASAPDYDRRIRNFVEDFARDTGRTEEDLARTLMYVEDDVIDLTLRDVADVLPLHLAAGVIGHAKDLIVASACSALARKAYHGRSQPNQAKLAAKIVGMGHTRRDCFIIPLVSPASALRPVQLGVALEQEELDLGLVREPAYFPRRVTGMMANALQSIEDLAVKAPKMPGNEELQRAVLDGLSADACEATADMVSDPGAGSLDVSFRWALTAVPLSSSSDVIDFPAEAAEAIRQVGRLLRNQVSIDDAVLYVVSRTGLRPPSRGDLCPLPDIARR